MRRYLFPALAAALIAGCNEFPELENSLDESAKNAPYPELIPVDGYSSSLPQPGIEDETQEQLEARASGLKARAAKLKQNEAEQVE